MPPFWQQFVTMVNGKDRGRQRPGIVLIRNQVHPVVLRGLKVPIPGDSGGEIIIFAGFF